MKLSTNADPGVDIARIRAARAAFYNGCSDLNSFYNNAHIEHGPALSRLSPLLSETDTVATRCACYAKSVIENLTSFQPGDPIHRSLHVLDDLITQGRRLEDELKAKWSNDHFKSFFAELNTIKTDFHHKANALKNDIEAKNHHSQANKDQSIVAGTFAGVAAASLIAAPFTFGLSMLVFGVSSAVSIGTGIGAGVNGFQAECIDIRNVDYDGATQIVGNITSSLQTLADELVLFSDYWLGLVELIDTFLRDLKQTASSPSESAARALRRLHEHLNKHPVVDGNTVMDILEDETYEGYAKRLWLPAMATVVHVRKIYSSIENDVAKV